MKLRADFLGTLLMVIVASLLCCARALSADRSADEAAIRNLEARQQEAWNHHDAKAYASLFTEDGEVVNVIASFQNTNSVPEMPFPTGPASPAEAKQEASPKESTALEMSNKETVASALLRQLEYEEYEVRSVAEAMPEGTYDYRPAEGKFKNEKPEYGPPEMRTFAEQVKHVACSNFAFAAELHGQKPPDACDTGGTSPAKTRKELLIYLRDSFAAVKKSLGAITAKNMFDPIEGPYAGPNTRLGLAEVVIWHAADHYGQMVLYLRLNDIVPPASRPHPPELQEKY